MRFVSAGFDVRQVLRACPRMHSSTCSPSSFGACKPHSPTMPLRGAAPSAPCVQIKLKPFRPFLTSASLEHFLHIVLIETLIF